MAKKKPGIVTYFLRGLVAAVAGFIIMLPLSYVMALLVTVTLMSALIIIVFLVYAVVVLVISGWIMTKVVERIK